MLLFLELLLVLTILHWAFKLLPGMLYILLEVVVRVVHGLLAQSWHGHHGNQDEQKHAETGLH